MRQSVLTSFQKLIDVNTPIIYINDYDFARIDELIKQVIGKKDIVEWNCVSGYTNFNNKRNEGGVVESLEQFLEKWYKIEIDKSITDIPEKFIILKEAHSYIEESHKVRMLLALMSQRKLYDRRYDTTVIIVSSVRFVPTEIEKYVSQLDVELPDDNEINRLIDEHIEENKYDASKFEAKDREDLMPSLKGMTAFEIDRMLDMAMSSNGSLSAEDKEGILKQKKQMVRQSGVLELVESKEKIEDIGGMENLKIYLNKKACIMKNISSALKFGVAMPKGVFIVGMPGCGKSLCAKATSALFQAPLLKMDMGSMMGKYVGQSEENLRKAIKIAEATAPCVLWIDEIEKAFSGVGGNNDILTRMFGFFLGWMQDKTSSVFVVATANNADKLPPELKRKGRFDEIFCVNLPNSEEREAIFKVHINKKSEKDCKIDDLNYKELAEATVGFNGADIEAVVNNAVEECFLEGKKTLTTGLLKEKAKNTKSISKSCKKQIEEMEKLFKENDFTDASK